MRIKPVISTIDPASSTSFSHVKNAMARANFELFKKSLERQPGRNGELSDLLISDDKLDCCGLQKILQMMILDLVNWLDQI